MAQSRPPPSRTLHATSPPSSPRTSEKKHHSRRRSAKDYEARKSSSSRPAPLSRKSTPQYISSSATTKTSSRYREREDEERGRDYSSGESFPQFCMTCEKQFLPANNTFLYCSEICRLHDQAPTAPSASSQRISYSPPLTPYSRQFHPSTLSTSSYQTDEPPDILPRFSPTQSRPRSYFNSDPYPSSSSYQSQSQPQQYSPPTQSSSALASLRELATALPKGDRRRGPESPPSSITRTGSGVWNYISGSGSGSGVKTSTPTATPGVTPGNSYSSYNPYTATAGQSYGGSELVGERSGRGSGSGRGSSGSGSSGRSKENLYSFSKSSTAGYGGSGYGNVAVSGAGYTASGGMGMGMDRPLPPRSGPGGYGHRPRSIDLVTPFGGL